jgi:PAS domain S-box-containing protein
MSSPSDSDGLTSAGGESKEQLMRLIENVKDYAIFMLDPRGHVTTWNQGAERLKGYTAEEIIGKHFSRFYPADAIAQGKPNSY